MNSFDLVQSPSNTGGNCPIAFTSGGLGAAATAAAAGCPPPPPPPAPPAPPPAPPAPPPLLPPPPPPPPPPLGGFGGGEGGGFPEGGILPMLEGNGALVCVVLVVVRAGEVIVMVGEMVGEVFSIWRMGSVLIP